MPYECNIFRGADDVDCSNVVSLLSVINAIKSGRWKYRVEEVRSMPFSTKAEKDARAAVKKHLPAVIFSGVFEERIDAACVHYNHVVVVDVDDISKRKLPVLKSDIE